MNIGERLNKFDLETDGTLKSFNELFPECPVKLEISPESVLEVKGIVGVGQELKRYIEVNDEVIEHSFEQEKYFVPNKKTKSGKTSYKAINLVSKKEYKDNTLKGLSNKMEVTERSLISFVNRNSAKLDYKWVVKKYQNRKLVDTIKPPLKQKNSRFVYSLTKGDKKFELNTFNEVRDLLKANTNKVKNHINKNIPDNINGWTVTKERV